MDGYRIDPTRFRALLGEANLTPAKLAEQVGCDDSTVRNFTRFHPRRTGVAAAEPSRELADAILAVLAGALGRQVAADDIATPVPSRWRRAA